jgi:hypothetical protein
MRKPRNIMREEALMDVCNVLLDDYDLTLGEISDLAKEIAGNCEDILQCRSEAAHELWYDPERAASRRATYEETLVAAGRGHLIG